jgi:tetratricopeptide (TPR) repeat protein
MLCSILDLAFKKDIVLQQLRRKIFIFLLLMVSDQLFSFDNADNYFQENTKRAINVAYLFGPLYANLDREKDEITKYKHALELEPENQDIRIKLAYSYLKQEDYTSAQELLQTVLIKEPKNIDAIYGLGLVEIHHKKFSQAETYFRKVLEVNPDYIWASLKLAEVLAQQNQNIEADQLYEKLLHLQPNDQLSSTEVIQIEEKASLVKAKVYLQEKKYEEALSLYNKLLVTSPKNPDYLFTLGRIYEDRGLLKEAIGFYKRALEQEPENQREIQIRLAYSYLKEKDFTSSQELFQAILSKDPDSLDALMGIGEVEAKLKHFPEAESYFNKVLKLDPKNVSARLQLADLHIVQNQSNQASNLCKEILNRDPNNERAQKILKDLLEKYLLEEAKFLTRQERYREATEIYEKLITLSPKNTDYYLLLGTSYLRMKCFLNAIEVLKEALTIKPNPELIGALAFAYLRKGTDAPLLWTHYQWFINYPYLFYFIPENIYPRVNWEDIETSQSLFEEVLEEKPQDADALAGLGRIEALEDNKEEAECLYLEALELQPENTTALAYYAALLASEGRYFSSRNTYEELLRLDPSDKIIRQDYIDQINRSDPIYSLLGFYSEENEQGYVTPTRKEWTARLKNYGGGFSCSLAVRDRLKLFGLISDEYFILNNLINKTTIYSLDVIRANFGFSWNYNPYVVVSGGCGIASFSQHNRSTFFTREGLYTQPFLGVNYNRDHHNFLIETNADAPLVARNFTNLKSALIDRQFLRAFYEYNFGNRTLIGTTAANIWYINRIKNNQQQLASGWVQWGPRNIWQYLVFRYQFIYSRFNKLTPEYYTFRYQTTQWLTATLSKNWLNNKLVTEAGYGRAWQRSFEQGQIIVVNPVIPFHVVNRRIDAAYARLECRPTDCMDFAVTGEYTLDSFNYTTASITGRFSWRF